MEERTQIPCIESGVELLARLSGRKTFSGLEDTLFDEQLRPGDLIEITGETAAGKTLLLSQMIGKCLLPVDGPASGCGASAVLINTDHHFDVSKLVDLMIHIMRNASEGQTYEAVKDACLSYLHNLIVVQCYNVNQFLLTLHSLDKVLLSDRNIALLAVDSIAAYYWEDRKKNGLMSIDSYVNKMLKILRTNSNQFNIVTVYTRTRDKHAFINSLNLYGAFNENPNYRVLLCNTENSDEFTCVVKTKKGTFKELGYKISKSGVQWT